MEEKIYFVIGHKEEENGIFEKDPEWWYWSDDDEDFFHDITMATHFNTREEAKKYIANTGWSEYEKSIQKIIKCK